MGEIMAGLALPKKSEHLYGMELDETDSRLIKFLQKTYKGDDLDGYMETCIKLNQSIGDPRIKKYLVDSFIGEETSKEEQEYAQREFLKRSIITQEVRPFQGTSKLTERLYDNNIDPNEHPIDYQITKMPSAQATKHRLPVMKEEIKKAIRHAADNLNRGTVNIIDWGSGPGRYAYQAAHELKDSHYGEAMKFTLFDIKQEPLDDGEKKTKELGVHEKFSFVQGDLGDVIKVKGNGDNDIGILSGILCSLSNRVKWYAVKGLKSHLSDTGCLISASSSKKMKIDDPYLDHWRREQGFWPLDYVSPIELRAIYRFAGYLGKLHTTHENPWKHYVIIRGYVKNSKRSSGL